MGKASDDLGDFRASLGQRAARQPPVLIASLIAGFLIGLGYHAVSETPSGEFDRGYLLSGVNGAAIATAAWAVQFVFASAERSHLGAALRRLPLAAEVIVRAVALTVALAGVGLAVQLALFPAPAGMAVMAKEWLTAELPRFAAISFGVSFLFRMVLTTRQLIGGQLLMNALLGTYQRSVRKDLIVMYLDLANSTRLAEAMGEVKVHDLITRFFFDIDAPIQAFGGEVHAYVGDEAIVVWPLLSDAPKNSRAIGCFFAIDARMRRLAPTYEKTFGVAPSFRAGIHVGPVIMSECGDSRRQLAFFGDTMNVGARLCDYCKTIDERLIVSGALMRAASLPDGVSAAAGEPIQVRGREEPVEAYAVRRRSAGPRARSPL